MMNKAPSLDGSAETISHDSIWILYQVMTGPERHPEAVITLSSFTCNTEQMPASGDNRVGREQCLAAGVGETTVQ